MGAYPTLTAHFAAANLDPQANLWDKVKPQFTLLCIACKPCHHSIAGNYWQVCCSTSCIAPDDPGMLRVTAMVCHCVTYTRSYSSHPGAFGYLQVYDISAEDGAKQSFEFVQSAQYWEVPISGQGSPENPVPAADGSAYQVCMHLLHAVAPPALHSLCMPGMSRSDCSDMARLAEQCYDVNSAKWNSMFAIMLRNACWS